MRKTLGAINMTTPKKANPQKGGKKKKVITPAILKRAEQLASRGLYDKDIMPLIGISHDTFYRWRNESPEFSEAIDRGRASGHAQVANKLFESAMAGNVSACQYYLARRAGWKETQQVQALDEHGERTKWQIEFVNADKNIMKREQAKN